MQAAKIVIIAVSLAACYRTSDVRGSAVLSMQPAPPTFEGRYDFDLLEQVRGKACVRRTTRRMVYWAGAFAFDKVPADPLTLSAISAASIDALEESPDADTILVTRVITEGKNRGEACAWVFGRAVRIKKAGETEDDSDDSDDDPGHTPGPVPTAEPGSYDVFDHPRPPSK